jgi:formate dehydrogenase maturation protein FdhE
VAKVDGRLATEPSSPARLNAQRRRRQNLYGRRCRLKQSECDMRHPEFLLLASELRSRAQEVLARAANMDDAQAQDIMRAIAVGYENLAQRFELFAA